MEEIIRAIYLPTHDNYFNQRRVCIGKEFEFKYVDNVQHIKRYEAVDKNFPSSNPIRESDLEIIDETLEI